MEIRIVRSEDPEISRITLSLQGSLTSEYVGLIEAECSRLLLVPTRLICIDLKELTFLDETGAATLARLKECYGVTLLGSDLFIQQMIDGAVEDT